MNSRKCQITNTVSVCKHGYISLLVRLPLGDMGDHVIKKGTVIGSFDYAEQNMYSKTLIG